MSQHDQTQVRQAVRRTWNDFKSRTGATQEIAAKNLDMGQSAFSQYLRGAIPMNTDFILRFAKYTGTNPSTLDPSLAERAKEFVAQTKPVRVTAATSGMPATGFVMVTVSAGKENLTAMRDDLGLVMPGVVAHLVLDHDADIRDGDLVVVEKDGAIAAGRVVQNRDDMEWYLQVRSGVGLAATKLDGTETIKRVCGMHLPEGTGRKYR